MADILASLFDIIRDKNTVGIQEDELLMTYSKPLEVFNFDDEKAVQHFLQKPGEESTYDDLVSLQYLF